MLLDNETLFSDAQAVTASAASTNVVHMAKGKIKEVATGEPMPLLIQVVTDFAGLTSVKVSVQTATDAAFTSPVTLAETGAIALASLKAGYRFPINFVPKGNLGYMRLYYTVVGTGTAGKITAGVVAALDNGFQDVA